MLRPFKAKLALSFIFLIHVHAYAFDPFADPNAPVDGGLGALLIAGSLIGYRAIKNRKS